jgi:hypothetical protein
MMANPEEHDQVNRRGIRITVVLMFLAALALYIGPMIMAALD